MTYDEEELVVESVAFTVCGSLGFDTSDYSIPYLASWSENAELETIERAAGVIDRIARQIEDALDSAAGDGEADDEPELPRDVGLIRPGLAVPSRQPGPSTPTDCPHRPAIRRTTYRADASAGAEPSGPNVSRAFAGRAGGRPGEPDPDHLEEPP